jgi:hypothetical protein
MTVPEAGSDNDRPSAAPDDVVGSDLRSPDEIWLAAWRQMLNDFVPMVERVESIEAGSAVRLRATSDRIAGFVRLPFDVVGGRAVAADGDDSVDITLVGAEFLRWTRLEGAAPQRRDMLWIEALPPTDGWHRIETVPDSEIRPLVRTGAMLAKSMSSRTEQSALLNGTVLHITHDQQTYPIPLRALSALTRMGFLPKGTDAAIDISAGWLRIAAGYGSTYIQRDDSPLKMLAQL